MDFHGLAIFFGLLVFANSFPQQGFNTDGAQDPNSVDESIGWSWGVSSSEDRNTNNQPNQFPGNFNTPRTPQQQTTSAAPSGVTNLPSETFLRCVDNCPTTSEYNPVCGSDMQSYHNMAKFGCAVSCGARIRVIRVGTCLPVNG